MCLWISKQNYHEIIPLICKIFFTKFPITFYYVTLKINVWKKWWLAGQR